MVELLTFDFSDFHDREHGGHRGTVAFVFRFCLSVMCEISARRAVALAKKRGEEIPAESS